MSDFIASLQAKGICRLIPQIGATGSWTIHFHKTNGYANHTDHHSSTIGSSTGSGGGGYNGYTTTYPPSQASTVRAAPTPIIIHLKRVPGDSIGLSIVAAQVIYLHQKILLFMFGGRMIAQFGAVEIFMKFFNRRK